MDIKKAMNDWAKKHDESSMELSQRMGRRSAYHRFFEGYTEVRVPRPSGHGTMIQRVYTGAYYCPKLTGKQMALYRVVYALLYVIAAALFISTALMNLPGNRVWYATLPQMAVLPMLVWYLIAYGCYLPLRERIEIPAWRRSSLALRRASIIAAVCAFVAAVTGLLAVGLDGEAPVADGLLAALRFTLCGTALLAINRLEAHIVYEQVDNNTAKPLGGVDIDG